MAAVIRLRMPDDQVAPVVKALTQLTVKAWLIQQGRWDDLLVYSTACEVDAIPTCQLYEKEALDKGIYEISIGETHGD